MNSKPLVAVVATCLLSVQCVIAEESVPVQARQVLKRHCLKCHSSNTAGSKYFNAMDVAAMIESGEYLSPGDPDDSLIYSYVMEEMMPPSDERETDPVTEQEREILKKWISEGAKAFPDASQRTNVSVKAVYSSALSHLRSVNSEDRRFVRFFTLHNVQNRSSTDTLDLRYYQAGLSKALNSLSWQRRIRVPRPLPLNAGEKPIELTVLFAIDLRDYGWEKNEAWMHLQRVYPYGTSVEFADEQLHELTEAVASLTGSELPILRIDWFIANATRPPLYHQILALPENAKTLEARLGVAIEREFLDPSVERLARAGFAESFISAQNRMVQRSDAEHGFYWKSYDFKPDTGRANLTRFPLGPANLFSDRKHPFSSFAFEHDGGEIIFSLPNGLQAYMLIDGSDNRIDEGPIDVVYDKLKTSGSPSIVNGLSCMACHKKGMIPFKDSIREQSATFGPIEKHVQRIYPVQEEMDRLVRQDSEQFQRALLKCLKPFLLDSDVDSDGDILLAEPIGKVAVWHRSVFLDLDTVLTELDLSSEVQLRELGERTLKKLGLLRLLDGGVVSRPEWEAFDRKFGPSLMQQTAAELNQTPVRPL